jgi:hypothetical protein
LAFDFLGTFNKSQLDRLLLFLRSQTSLIEARVNHLESEKMRIGQIIFKHQPDGSIVGYSTEPKDSYIGKLFAAYEALGGDPFRDLDIRLRNDPVYKLSGTEINAPEKMSNGEVIGAPGLADAQSAEYVRNLTSWANDTLQWRRERLERKIRRAVDYYDELDREVLALGTINMGETFAKSIEGLAKELVNLINAHDYRAIYDDKGSDPGAKNTGAPLASYEPGKDGTQEAGSTQKGVNGITPRGASG